MSKNERLHELQCNSYFVQILQEARNDRRKFGGNLLRRLVEFVEMRAVKVIIEEMTVRLLKELLS